MRVALTAPTRQRQETTALNLAIIFLIMQPRRGLAGLFRRLRCLHPVKDSSLLFPSGLSHTEARPKSEASADSTRELKWMTCRVSQAPTRPHNYTTLTD